MKFKSFTNKIATRWIPVALLTIGFTIAGNQNTLAQENKSAPVLRSGTSSSADIIRDRINHYLSAEFDLDNPGKTPLFIFAGLEISKEQFDKIDPLRIGLLSIQKSEQATAFYGEKGHNGAVIIEPKNNPGLPKDSKFIDQFKKGMIDGATIIVDGKAIDQAAFAKLKNDEILSARVIDDKTAMDRYGIEANKGAIDLLTKQLPPEFPGGINAWRDFISKNFEYPKQAIEKGTQGAVTLQFVVAKDGTISEIKALNDPGDGLAEAAVNILKKSPKWQPAEQSGETVATVTTKKISFYIQ